MKRLVILNPKSRDGSAARLFEQQRSELEKLLGHFDLYHTTAAGDATLKVGAVLEGGDYDQIIVAGGDGTVNEAFRGYWKNGAVSRSDIPIGIVNLGTGGDLFRTVEAGSSDYRDALAQNRFQSVDAARVIDGSGGRHHFLNIASVGMAGDMLRRLKSSRFQAGASAYFYHTLRTLIAYSPRHVELEMVDGEGRSIRRDVDILNFFVCNGRFSGGGMEWAPRADLTSGSLNVTMIGGRKKLPLVLQSRKLYAGAIDSFPGAETFEAKQVIVKCRQSISLETDGEIIDSLSEDGSEIRFEILEKVFPLVM